MAKYEFQAEIAEAGVVHVMPSYAPFAETYLYLQEATEADYNKLMFEIGVGELGVLEATGSEVIYEADDEKGEATETEAKQSVKDKIIAFVKAQWEKVKGAFDSLLEKIQKKMAEAKAKFKGATVSKIKANLEKGRLKETGKDGSVKSFGKFAPYTKLDQVNSALKTEVNTTDLDKSVDEIKKELRGEEFDVDRQWISSNLEKIVDYAFDFKVSKKSILTSYNTVKKGFDAEVKAIKVGPGEVKVKTDHAKAQVKVLNKIASACVQLHIERQARALSLLTKVAVGTLAKSEAEKEVDKEKKDQQKAENKAARKEAIDNAKAKGKEAANAVKSAPGNIASAVKNKFGKKEENANESAVVAESYTTEVEKLFDWNF